MGRVEYYLSLTEKIRSKLIETLSVSSSILKDIKYRYERLRNPLAIIEQYDVMDLTDRLLPIISRPNEVDPKSLTNQLFYAASRLPTEIFTNANDIIIKFDDDPSHFFKDGHLKEGVKSAKGRKRYYFVQEISEKTESGLTTKKTQITIHAQSQTAVVETMVHISLIEQLRDHLKKVIGNDLLLKDNLLDQRYSFLWEILNLFINNPKTNKNEVFDWINRKIEFRGSENLNSWSDLKNKSKTAKALAVMTKEKLEGNNLPRGIIFSNNFSLPNILSHYLLEKKVNGQSRRKIIMKKALIAWEEYRKRRAEVLAGIKGRKKDVLIPKTALEAIGESLHSLHIKNDEDVDKELSFNKQFIIDNLIIFDLTRNGESNTSESDTVVEDFLKEFNSPERLKNFGIKKIISENESPTADSVSFIDFSEISDEVIAGLNPLIKNAIIKLKEKKYSALYMPYAPGDLTYSIIKEMKEVFPSLESMIEIGKVAHYVSGTKQRKISEIGQLVLPVETFDISALKPSQRYGNQVKSKHIEPFEKIRSVDKTVLIQVPSVILQDIRDIVDYLEKVFKGEIDREHFTLNMEVSSFLEAKNFGLKLFEADYISDHAVGNDVFKEFVSQGKEKLFRLITKSLDRKGRHGVHAATAAVLLALAESL